MEEENKKIEEDAFKVSENIPKKGTNFVIKYVIFLLVLIGITALVILSTISQINKENASKNEIGTDTQLRASNDKKYVITSYSDTYNSNSIKITEYYDVGGTVTTDEQEFYDAGEWIRKVKYIQIDGLKNKKIQSDINKKLREKAYSLKGTVYTYIVSNFSNILSIEFDGDKNEYDTLNIDLSTGNEIKFEELFISSTPINSILESALYRTLARAYIDNSDDYNSDMNKIDMSRFEDQVIILLNNYNKQKENLKFNIYTRWISIHGLIDDRIIDSEYASTYNISIDLINYMEYVTIYKRFLSNENIYEDTSIGQKNTIVFTGGIWEDNYLKRLNYGKIRDNVFVEEVMSEFYDNNENDPNNVKAIKNGKEFINKLSNEYKKNEIDKVPSNRGAFLQRQYSFWYDSYLDKKYFTIYVASYKATCSTAYFANDAFLDYIKLKSSYGGEGDTISAFDIYYQDDFPNLSISEAKYEEYYISLEGEVIGKTYEEAEEWMRKQNQSIEETNAITNEIITNTVDNTPAVNNTETNQNKITNVDNQTNNTNTDNNETKNEMSANNVIV